MTDERQAGLREALATFVGRNVRRMDPDAEPVMGDHEEVVLYGTAGEFRSFVAALAVAHVPAQEERLRAAAQEVWDSVPATYDDDDLMVQRHSRALNELGAVLRALEVETKESDD